MKIGKVLSFKKRIKEDEYDLHDTVKEMVNEWGQIPTDLIEALIERFEDEAQKHCPIPWLMGDLLVASRDPRFFRIYVNKGWLPETPDFYLQILKSGLNAEQIEGRLCELLERDFISRDGIYVRIILDALGNYGSTDCLAVLQRLEYDLEKRFEDARAKISQPFSYERKPLMEIDLEEALLRKGAILDVQRDAALSSAIQSIIKRDKPRDEDWLINFEDLDSRFLGFSEDHDGVGSHTGTDLVLDFLTRKEGKHLEFKESLRGGGIGNNTKQPEWRVSRTIAAFANTDGGTLLIGVHDDGRPVGISDDFKSVNGGQDQYQLRLNQVINAAFGASFTPLYIVITFHEVESLLICRVDVKRSEKPIFLRNHENKETDQFWVRNTGQTNELKAKEQAYYIKSHWRD